MLMGLSVWNINTEGQLVIKARGHGETFEPFVKGNIDYHIQGPCRKFRTIVNWQCVTGNSTTFLFSFRYIKRQNRVFNYLSRIKQPGFRSVNLYMI